MDDFQERAFLARWECGPDADPVFKSLSGGRVLGMSVHRAADWAAGDPVWTVSFSRRTTTAILGTGKYTQEQRAGAIDQMTRALRGAGDESRQRCTRTNTFYAIERAFNDLEIARLPKDWRQVLPLCQGGAIEVLWSTVEEGPACLPCENPEKRITNPYQPELWMPFDCGACGPCLARVEVQLMYADEQPSYASRAGDRR